jgi:transcriptional regulator with XRE-family HTH domain
MTTLREWRRKNTLSQRDLAKLSGVALSTITLIETGKHKAQFVTLRKLAKALKVEPSQIDF